MRYNFLLLKEASKCTELDRLLVPPYQNIVVSLVHIALGKEKAFDLIYKRYVGLRKGLPRDLGNYYEALLAVTSYFQHSQGGRAAFIEKMFAQMAKSAICSGEIKDLPIWFTLPDIYKKSRLYGKRSLSKNEEAEIEVLNWKWIGAEDDNITFDLGNLIDRDKIVFMEIKNRVDSGGTAGRREILLTRKIGGVLNLIISGRKIFRYDDKQYSLIEFLGLGKFKIKSLSLTMGVIFNIDGAPATLAGDRSSGFYSSNKEGFRYVKSLITSRPEIFNILSSDDEKLTLEAQIKGSNIKLYVRVAYGDDIIKTIFGRKGKIGELPINYDDLRFTQLLSIKEREIFNRYRNNSLSTAIKLISKGSLQCQKIIEAYRKNVILNIVNHEKKKFDKKFVPREEKFEDYIGKILLLTALYCTSVA